MEERKNVPFTLVKRKTDESLEKILCSLLKTQNIHGKDGKSTCKPFLLCGMLILWKRLLPSETGRARAEHSRERMGLVAQTTKRALEASLKKLLVQKPLNKITINDITEDCGVNRMTFYYHFKDIYDLVEWSCLEDATQALQGKKTYETWQEGLQQIFEAVLENKPFIMNVYHSVSREQIETYLFHLTHDLLYGVVQEKAKGTGISEADQSFIADFYKYSFTGVMLDWIKDGMKVDYHMIAEKMHRTMEGNVVNSIRNFEKRNKIC